MDHFAFCRGHDYGAVVVDLERHKVIDLLPNRSAVSLAEWLKAHPSVEVVARDRSTEFARGVAEGAPQAVEVLDRWHVLKNLGEALERRLNRDRKAKAEALAAAGAPVGPPPRTGGNEEVRALALERRRALYGRVRELHGRGGSVSGIACELRVTRGLVRRGLQVDGLPERVQRGRRASILDPFEPRLRTRWAEGCRNGLQLWRELRERGFSGSRRQVSEWAQQRQEALAPTTPKKYREGVAERQREAAGAGMGSGQLARGLVPARLTWLLLHDDARLDDEERAALRRPARAVPEGEERRLAGEGVHLADAGAARGRARGVVWGCRGERADGPENVRGGAAAGGAGAGERVGVGVVERADVGGGEQAEVHQAAGVRPSLVRAAAQEGAARGVKAEPAPRTTKTPQWVHNTPSPHGPLGFEEQPVLNTG